MIATLTPTSTPMARLLVSTVTSTVVSITMFSLCGMRLRVEGLTLCQSNVATETMIITATSAAMGMRPTAGPKPTTRISRNTPARNVEMRVRAPETLTGSSQLRV